MNRPQNTANQNTQNTANPKEENTMNNKFNFDAMTAYKSLGYKPTQPVDAPVITKTVKRDHSIEALVKSIIYNVAGCDADFSIIQDPKGRVTIYNADKKPVFKYRPHSKGVVIYFPTRTRAVADEMGLKLTEHGYFGHEGALDTDKPTLLDAVARIANL